MSLPAEPNSRADWEARYATSRTEDRPASSWVIEQCGMLPRGSLVCDIAGGTGRHASALAQQGHRVALIDFAEGAVRAAMHRSRTIFGVVGDVAALPFRAAVFDGIVITNFLDRDLIPAFIALLRPGGHLVYETYTTEHVALVAAGLSRAPRSARYLLHSGELRSLVSPLTIVAYREGDIEDEAGRRACASVHAIR